MSCNKKISWYGRELDLNFYVFGSGEKRYTSAYVELNLDGVKFVASSGPCDSDLENGVKIAISKLENNIKEISLGSLVEESKIQLKYEEARQKLASSLVKQFKL